MIGGMYRQGFQWISSSLLALIMLVVASFVAHAARIVASGPMIFYGSASGNDANDGLTVNTPKKTPQLLWNLAAYQYDFAGYPVKFKFAAGHYTDGGGFNSGLYMESGLLGAVGVLVEGEDNIGSTFFDFTDNCITAGQNVAVTYSNLKMKSLNTTAYAGHYAYLILGPGNIFDSAGQWHIGAGQFATHQLLNSYRVINDAPNHYQVADKAMITNEGASITVTIDTSVSFGVFAVAQKDGIIVNENLSFSGRGSQNGATYFALTSGKIFTGSNNANFYPGNGGFYNDGTGTYK